jgi:hypothetical protein
MRKQLTKPIENPNRAIFNYIILDSNAIADEDYESVFNYDVPYPAQPMNYSCSIFDNRDCLYTFGLIS